MSSKKQQEKEEGAEKIPKTKQNQNKTKTATEKVEESARASERRMRKRWEKRSSFTISSVLRMFVH